MATARKDQPWGVRTIYRNGRSVLVGPYRGRRAAVEGLQTGNGRVRSSTLVFIGLGLRDSTGPTRILRERFVTDGGSEVVPPVGDPEVLDVVYSEGQGYQVEVSGQDLDQADRFVFTTAAGTVEVSQTDDPGAFTSITPELVVIFTEDFAGELLTSLQLQDENSVDIGSDVPFTDISFPNAVTVSSPVTDAVRIDGTRLIEGINSVELVTDQGTRIYYDPNGPNAGNNPGTAIIDNWVQSQVQIIDTWFTDNGPVTVDYIYFARELNNSIAGYEDVNLVVLQDSAFEVTLVEPYGSDEPSLYIEGTDLDLVEVFRFAATGDESELEYHLPADIAQFVVLSGGSAVIKDTALSGTRVTDLQIETELAVPLAPNYDIDPDAGFTELTTVASESYEALHVEGKILDVADRLELNDGAYTLYNPAGPNAGSNAGNLDIVTWDATDVQVVWPDLAGQTIYKVQAYRDDTGLSYPASTPMFELDSLSVEVAYRPVVEDVVSQSAQDSAQLISITGQYLDALVSFRIFVTGDEAPYVEFTTTGTPADFAGIQDFEVLIQSDRLHGNVLESLEVRDALGDLVQTFDIDPDISVAQVDDVLSPADETLRVEGTYLSSVDALEVTTQNFTQTYYDPNGPNAGSNAGTVTIVTWTDTVIEVVDTEYTAFPGTEVSALGLVRVGTEYQYIHPVSPEVPVAAVPETVTITSVVQSNSIVENGSAQVYVAGVNMDLLNELVFTASVDETELVFQTGGFSAQDENGITLDSVDFTGCVLESVVGRKVIAGADDATFDIDPDLGLPEVDDILSPGPETVRLEGHALDSVDVLYHFAEGVPNNNGYAAYDPNGPNVGSQDAAVTIIEWTDSVIEFVDTRFTSQSRGTVEHVVLADASNTTTWDGNADPVVTVDPASGVPELNSALFLPREGVEPFRLTLDGTSLDLVEEVTVQTTAGPLVYNTTDDAAVFLSQTSTDITLGTTDFHGAAITSVDIADSIGGSVLDSYDYVTGYGQALTVPNPVLSSPQPGWVMAEGANLVDIDRLDIEVPGAGPEEWITYYGPTHPDFATNDPAVSIMLWDDDQIVVQDDRFTFDNAAMSPVTQYRLWWSWADMPWDEEVNVTVNPGYAGPIDEIHSVSTDRYGLAVLGTGLDLIDILTVQGCGNGGYGDFSAQQGPNNFQTTYEETDPEVVSWTASQIIVNDPAAFQDFSGFVWRVIAGTGGEELPYWYVNYPADDTPMVSILGPDAYTAPFWYPIASGIQNGNVYGYQIAEAQEDGLDRIEIDTVEEGTLVVYGANSPSVASSTPGITATYVGSGTTFFDADVFDDELTVTEYRAYRGNGALYYTSAPDGIWNPTSLGGEVNVATYVSGSDESGIQDITPLYPSDPALAGFRLNLDVGEFDMAYANANPPSPFDPWEDHPELAGRVVEGVTPINALGSGIAPEYTGTQLPFALPSVLPLSMSNISPYTENFGDGLAQFYVGGNYLQTAVRAALTASGDETTFDLTAPVPAESFTGAGAFISTALPGCLLEDVVLYDALDNVVATGALNFQWAEVENVSGSGGQTLVVDGKQLHGVDNIQALWGGNEYRTYYHPSGPDAGSNDPDLVITNWTDTQVNVTDPYIGSYYPGTTFIDQLSVQSPSNLGQFFSTSDLIDVT